MLLQNDLETLMGLSPETLDGSLSEGFNQIVANNCQEEQRKRRDRRTPNQIISDTAKGIGFEHYVNQTGMFEVVSPIVENPRENLKYSERQKDFRYNGKAVQVKTISKVLGLDAYLGNRMRLSIEKCIPLNDFFLFGLAKIQGSRDDGSTTYTYSPGFVISSECLSLSIREHDGMTYVGLDGLWRRPDHFQALDSQLIERIADLVS
jgi:hypothetical protein